MYVSRPDEIIFKLQFLLTFIPHQDYNMIGFNFTSILSEGKL